MRALTVLVVSLAAAPVLACPACASAQRSVLGPAHVVLVLLPFVVAGLAALAIRAALR